MVASVVVGCVPALGMLACTVAGLHVAVPDDVAGALQHFAAGLLLSAVGCELLPTLLDASGFRENLFATVGFFAGMAALIVLGHLLPEHDDGGGDRGTDDGIERPDPPRLRKAESLANKRSLWRTVSKRGIAKAMKGAKMTAGDAISENGDRETPAGEGDRLLTSSAPSLANAARGLPLSFLAAVLVDSFMDGFLLGIAGVAGPGAAIIMAGSLTVEMSFVGLTLAAACRGLPRSQSVAAAISGPLVLVGGALAGGLVSNAVADDPALLAGA